MVEKSMSYEGTLPGKADKIFKEDPKDADKIGWMIDPELTRKVPYTGDGPAIFD